MLRELYLLLLTITQDEPKTDIAAPAAQRRPRHPQDFHFLTQTSFHVQHHSAAYFEAGIRNIAKSFRGSAC